MVADIPADVALARLDPDRRTAIEVFCERVRVQFGSRLRDLRLYGSAARGDQHEESDMDILVLLDDADWDDVDAAWTIAFDVNPWVHPSVRDFEQYHAPRSRATGFYKELRRESIRL